MKNQRTSTFQTFVRKNDCFVFLFKRGQISPSWWPLCPSAHFQPRVLSATRQDVQTDPRETHLWDSQPIISQLHGLSGVVHRLHRIPGLPVWTQTCRKQNARVRASAEPPDRRVQTRGICDCVTLWRVFITLQTGMQRLHRSS